MSRSDVIRAWKDEEYRAGLSAEQLALLPENPAGSFEAPNAATSEGFYCGPTADCSVGYLGDAV